MTCRGCSLGSNSRIFVIVISSVVLVFTACSKTKQKTTNSNVTVSTIPGIGQMKWRTPEDLLEIGFSRSRVVMMNEFHAGYLRSVRTREVGRRILPTAHRVGVRYFAMEALNEKTAEMANRVRKIPWGSYEYFHEGYLSQPEMQALIQKALDLKWTLLAYEHNEPVGNREEFQGSNLTEAFESLPPNAKMLVWCGNSHHFKVDRGEKSLMGHYFWKLSGVEPFVIDQNQSVTLPDGPPRRSPLIEDLKRMGITEAGFLVEEAPSSIRWDAADAFIISTRNEVE